MSVDFSNVKIGDRIKLTRENGDESTFTVHFSDEWCADDAHSNGYYNDEWDTLEILEKPLPTNEHSLIGHPTTAKLTSFLLRKGEWRTHDGELVDEKSVKYCMKSEGYEVLYEGIPADA